MCAIRFFIMMSFVGLVGLLSLISGTVSFLLDAPPCIFKNVTNPYTRKLEYIADCSGRSLLQVPRFTGNMTRVDRLLLNNNKITRLANASFENIIPNAIDLSGNKINDISLAAFEGLEDVLEDLNLASNNLNLPLPGLLSLHSLHTLSLQYNPSIRRVFNNSFNGLTNLAKLDLRRNYIGNFDSDAFQNLNNLSELLLYSNNIVDVPTDALRVLSNLRTLNFDSNSIVELRANAFQGLSNLKELQLSRNHFDGVEQMDANAFKGLDNLETLGFYHDNLRSVPNHTFPSIRGLKHLDISFTGATNMDPGTFAALFSLQDLDISGTRVNFVEGMFQGLENTLQNILIRYNDLTSLPLSSLSEIHSLQWVDAAKNNFPSPLPPNFAWGLSINRLGLMWMNISGISHGAFNGLRDPLTVEFDQDHITNLDFVTDPCHYNFISVVDNPIICDCHVYNLTMAKVIHFDGSCASPPNYKGLAIGGTEFKQLAKEDCRNQRITGPVHCPWS